jgi:hypothetical protein
MSRLIQWIRVNRKAVYRLLMLNGWFVHQQTGLSQASGSGPEPGQHGHDYERPRRAAGRALA